MGHSFYFLTATWLAAQGIEPLPGTMGQAPCLNCQNGGYQQPMPMQQTGGGRRFFGGHCHNNPGVFARMGQRIRGLADWCRGEDDDDQSCMHNMNHMNMNMNQGSMGNAGNMTPSDLNLSLPGSAKMSEPPLADTTQNPAPKALAPINFRPQGNGKASCRGVSANMADKVGHENDFSWITGQLRRDNGHWDICFATPETVDRYNGRLTLAPGDPRSPGPDMSKFQDGDLVTAHGYVLSQRGSQPNLYQANSVDLIEHDAR